MQTQTEQETDSDNRTESIYRQYLKNIVHTWDLARQKYKTPLPWRDFLDLHPNVADAMIDELLLPMCRDLIKQHAHGEWPKWAELDARYAATRCLRVLEETMQYMNDTDFDKHGDPPKDFFERFEWSLKEKSIKLHWVLPIAAEHELSFRQRKRLEQALNTPSARVFSAIRNTVQNDEAATMIVSALTVTGRKGGRFAPVVEEWVAAGHAKCLRPLVNMQRNDKAVEQELRSLGLRVSHKFVSKHMR